MTRDDIIRMARKAQLAYGSDEAVLHSVELFAALIADAKQEQIARQWDALHEQYMADPLRRQMMLSYEMVARMIRRGGNLTFGVRK